MTRKRCRLLAWLLAFALCFSLTPASSARTPAMSLSEVEQLLNGVELHPQRTGYPEIDQMLEAIVEPCGEADTYTKIKTMYDWVVANVQYDWEGYSQDWGSAYDKFTLTYDLAYETGLPEAFPEDVINRVYHSLTAKKGVCYDYAALFAIMARYIGVESYVHTGWWARRSHHGWAVLCVNGTNYIFDPQPDHRHFTRGEKCHANFGIPPASAGNYSPETKVNAARDASFLPITAERVRQVNVTVTASRSGQVTGGGQHVWGEPVTLRSQGGLPVESWYDASGTLLSEEAEYTFVPEGDTEVSALFQGDRFLDIPADVWYTQDVCDAAELGLIQGETAATFVPDGKMTRAMLVVVLSRLDGADVSDAPPCPFQDVPQDAWYAQAVNWAYANGVVTGAAETAFDPGGTVTREQAAVMMVRYLDGGKVPEAQAVSADGGERQGSADSLAYTDADEIGTYAREAVARARELGIMEGYTDGTVRPQQEIVRAEGAVMLMRLVRCILA